MSGTEYSSKTPLISRPSSQSSTVPLKSVDRKEFNLGIKVDADEQEYDGTYSDSGEESGEDQGINNDEDDRQEDQEVLAEDAPIPSKKGNEEKKVKKASKKVSKQPQTKRKPYQLVMNVSGSCFPSPQLHLTCQSLILGLKQKDTQYPVVRFVGKKIFKWKLCYEAENLDCDLVWTDNAVQPETLGKMQPHQKINHFPGMFILARKNYLARNLKKMKKQFPEEYKFFPQTWLLPAEYNELRNEFEKTSKGKCKTFIVKPEASCQGRGIFLTRNLDDLNSTDHYVVQRYLAKPYLIDGLKFDFRIYVLLAGCDPIRMYVFKEGLARLATEEYEAPHRDNLDNLCMHLTNYAINKDNPNFEFNEDENNMDIGHKRSMTSVMKLLQEQGHDIEKLWNSIKDILIKTIVSAQPTLSHHYKSCQPDNYMNNMCFEILGFDVILDHQLRPWLLEINHTPSFTTDTPLDSLIKKNCIRDSIVLMNINNKTRNEIMQVRREQLQKRVLTGKKVKLSQEEKAAEIKKCQQKREDYESKNLGNYEKVYPLDPGSEDIYVEMQSHAQLLYENWTGANIRRTSKKDQLGLQTAIPNNQQQNNLVKPGQNPRMSLISKSGLAPTSINTNNKPALKPLGQASQGKQNGNQLSTSVLNRTNTSNMVSMAVTHSQSQKSILRKSESVNQDNMISSQSSTSYKLGSSPLLDCEDGNEKQQQTSRVLSQSNGGIQSISLSNIAGTLSNKNQGYLDQIKAESPPRQVLGGQDIYEYGIDKQINFGTFISNNSGVFQKPPSPHSQSSMTESRKHQIGTVQIGRQIPPLLPAQVLMASSTGLSSTQGEDDRQQNIKKYASMIVDLNPTLGNNSVGSKKIDTISSNAGSSTEISQSAYQCIRQSNSQNSTLQAFQPQPQNIQINPQQSNYINRQHMGQNLSTQSSQINSIQSGKILPGLIRNGFNTDNNSIKPQQRQIYQDRIQNNNGLYLQPKLFDLNLLTKINGEEEQMRREQLIRGAGQITLQSKQTVFQNNPAFINQNNYELAQRNIVSQNSNNYSSLRRK